MSATSSDRSATASPASEHSTASIDGGHLHQLACVETFLPLSQDVALVDEPQLPTPPVARINYSPNFRFVYGVYNALRSCIDYADTDVRMPRQQKSQQQAWQSRSVIRVMRTSPARWLLLLGFALRQCTSNYTVWKDRRDVIMSPEVLAQCTREQLPALAMPEVLLSTTASAIAKETAMAEAEEKQKKVKEVAAHWLPGAPDLYGRSGMSGEAETAATLSPWRAVHWELTAVGCFTRFYHKNFQVWHHRRELFAYALEQIACSAPASNDNRTHTFRNETTEDAAVAPRPSVWSSEERFDAYLQTHHGLSFADVDERGIVRAVLCDEDGKNYHAWLHLSWYLHAVPFLVQPPSWSALTAFADAVVAALPKCANPWEFAAHGEWAHIGEENGVGQLPACRRPTLPSSPLTGELDFTALLLQQDCLNNSAWCHRFSLFREDLIRVLWQQYVDKRNEAPVGDLAGQDTEFIKVVHALCMVEVDFALQWLYVDPTNESAFTHARAISMLFYTVVTRRAVLQQHQQGKVEFVDVLAYVRDAPLKTPVAVHNSELSANTIEGTVTTTDPSTARAWKLLRSIHASHPWSHYAEAFTVVRHMQQVLDTAVRQRVIELEAQAARVLRAAAVTTTSHTSSAVSIALLHSLYERGSQYLLDNFHQVDAALYFSCQAQLEEMWLLYLTKNERLTVQQRRPADAYRAGVKPEWLRDVPWDLTKPTFNTAADDAAVSYFLSVEATALNLAKRLTVSDPIRFKYWKFEAMNTMHRGYGAAL